jgi:hypothetical protein
MFTENKRNNMQKKTDIHELDIPKDDIECWKRYPKHRWVYERSRIYDAQNIQWSPIETDEFCYQAPVFELDSNTPVYSRPGVIFVKKISGLVMQSEVFITKGEIKHMRHIDPETGEELPALIGEIELRLNAFVTLHFVRFTGVISVESHGNEIHRIQLKPHLELSQEENQDILKIAKRIYKKNEITINGLTDRALHSELAS